MITEDQVEQLAISGSRTRAGTTPTALISRQRGQTRAGGFPSDRFGARLAAAVKRLNPNLPPAAV